LKQQDKIYISDAAMRNAVLMNEDIELDPDELGLIAETVVYKHLRSYYYNSEAQVGYFRESSRGKEIDIIIKKPKAEIMIEVKYRENAEIKENDAIVTMAQPSIPNLVITKKDIDFGFYTYGDKTIYKIPAYAFLYLLGLYESKELELE
jgi:predicted AAA+ superfamily ATPase